MDTTLLWNAATELGQAARKIEKRAGAAALGVADYEKTLALGVAADWLRWSARLKEIKFRRSKKQSSERIDGMEELTRFYYAWTAANALFGRTSVIQALDPTVLPQASELEKFRVLYRHAEMDSDTEVAHETTVRRLLFSHIEVTRFPWSPGIKSTPLLNVIYQKYSDATQHARANYQTVKAAIDSGDSELIDLSLVIYMTRNWTLHGSLLNSGFRGPKEKFLLYIDTINQALAATLLGAAKALHAVI